MNKNLSIHKNIGDYLLSITATAQSLLALIQLYLMDALHMDVDSTNRIRVIATAIPILLSMIVVFSRKKKLTTIAYGVTCLVLLFTVLSFPGRWEIMRNDVLKFTLPVVIPIGLCTASVRELPIFMKCLLYTSVLAALIGLLYAMNFLSGIIRIDGYSTAFAYSLLLPTLVLISRKQLIWKAFASLLMIEMIAIGSRGPLLLSVAYWLFSIFWNNISYIKLILITLALFFFYTFFFEDLILMLSKLFEALGISSRTLRLLLEDEIITKEVFVLT